MTVNGIIFTIICSMAIVMNAISGKTEIEEIITNPDLAFVDYDL